MIIKLRLHQLVLTLLLLLLPLAVLGSLDSLQHEDDDLVFDDMDEETLAQQPLIHPSPISSHHHYKVDQSRKPDSKTSNYEPPPPPPSQHQNKVERLWSLPDVTTIAGHVFKLKIPKQAFGGNVRHYKVCGSNNKPLPRWLSFEEATFTLMGVPSNKDVGQHHVSVKAYGMTNDDVADDLFTIQVITEKYNQINNQDFEKKTLCNHPARQTLMSLVLDIRYDELKSNKKVIALENLANHLGFHVSALSMSRGQNNNKQDNKSDNFTVIFTGPGNVKHYRQRRKDRHSTTTTLIQWQVGCDGQLWKHQSELIKMIRRQAKDKTLAKTLQLPVVLWQVKTNVKAEENEKNYKTNKNKKMKKKVDDKTRRRRRRREDKENEKDDLVSRSRREVGSGDYGTNNDNDNEDYDDNYDDDYDETYDDNERGGDDGDDNNEAITEIPRRFLSSSPSGDNSEPKIIEEPELEHPHRHHHGQQHQQQQETVSWKQPTEHINEDEIVSVIDRKYGTNAAARSSTMSTTTIARETTLQTKPTTTTTTTETTPSISTLSSTTQSSYSTLNTTTPELDASSMARVPLVLTPSSTTLKTIITTVTTNEASTTFSSSSSSSGSSPKSGFDSESVEESNRIDDSETSLPPIIKTTITLETTSPTTFPPTTLFNPITSDRPEVKMTFTIANNTTDQESETRTKQAMQSSPVLTTTTTTETSINRFDDVESSTILMITTSASESATVVPSTISTMPTTMNETIPTFAPNSITTTTTTESSSTTETREMATTTTTTEKVEYGVYNYPPRQDKRLQKVPVTAGKPLSYFIPADTFSDLEDGDTRNLKLVLYLKDNPLKDTHWLQFNSETQEVYGLPLEDDISVWDYDLVALDRQGLNVSDRLNIYVQQHKSSRSVNHEFSIHIKINKRFPSNVDWELKVVQSLAELYGDYNTSQITVRSINNFLDNNDHQAAAVFTWTNDSVPRSSKCPKDEINKLLHVLMANREGDPSAMLENVLSPEIRVKRVSFRGLRQCDDINNNQPVVPSSPPLPPKQRRPEEEEEEEEKENILEPKANNNSPMPRNQVDHISAVVGQLLIFRVPKDTFYDSEDGPTRHLKLSLLTSDRNPISSDDWLQFDINNQEFYGVPMKVGRKEYQLIATDKEGASANDNLVVVIEPASKVKPSAEFTIKLGVNYRLFSQSAMLKKNFIQKLRDLFGDKDTDAIYITSISPAPGDNNTMITWRNTTLPTAYCPDDEITRLSEVLFVKPDNKELTNKIESIMGSEFPVDQLTLTPMEICLGEFTRVHSHHSGNNGGGRMLPPASSDHNNNNNNNNNNDEDDLTSLGASSQDDYLITFVLPAIIISVMLILAGIIACVLYKRKRSGKMSVSENDDDERQTFRSKGIPVIFQDELEEKPDPGNKSPVILKEEKPPLPPPEYQQQKVDDGADQPMLLPKESSEEPYQPPPPFARMSDNTRQNRPKPTPTYRKPPPYVPP